MPAHTITVPQANPGAEYLALKVEIDDAVSRVLGSGRYMFGEEVKAFESEFAAWLRSRACVSCGNGTDALALALRALNVGPGATVVTVSHTAVATVAAIEIIGATPLLIDIEPNCYTMDPGELAEVLAHPPGNIPPIRAVIPVHLYGQPAELQPIIWTCRRYGVAVIEDCAQAHGAMIAGQKVGTFADMATFSFYPTKNLGALGDGGMLATQDRELGERISALRQYGWRTHYISEEVGVNSRLDEIQAAILRVKLQRLDTRNARRQQIAAAYDAALSGTTLTPPSRRQDASHVFHLYVIRAPERSALQAHLRTRRIGTSVHYPLPVHLQPAYRMRVPLGPKGCRTSEIAAEQVLSLPIYPELSDDQVAHVCEALRPFLTK